MRTKMIRIAVLFAASFFAACGGSGGDGGNSNSNIDLPPTAVINVNKTSGYAPLTVEFDGTSSSDRDGNIATYEWHTGDGNSYGGAQVTHTYTTLGFFSATLTVTDNDGLTSQRTVSIKVHAQAAGYYWGEYFSLVTGRENYIEAQIGSDHRIFAIQRDSWSGSWDLMGLFNGDADVVEATAEGFLTAEARDPYVFPDGSQLGSIQFAADIDPRWEIWVEYAGAGDGGYISLYYDEELNHPVAFADIEGTWTWTNGAGYEEIMTVNAVGAFVYSDTDGCTFSGQFTPIDTALNEFDIEYYLDTALCESTAGSGTRKGLAVVNDAWYDDIWLEYKFRWLEGPWAGRMGLKALSRPRPVAAATAVQKPKMAHPKKNAQLPK